MDTRIEAELADQLDKLATRYKQVAKWLGETIQDMDGSGRPPTAEILHDLEHTRIKFAELRDRVHLEAAAEGLQPLPDPDHLTSLDDLRHLLARVEDARTRLHRRKEMCQRARQALDRIQTLRHREEADFRPLADCQARAREISQQAAELEFSGDTDPPADVFDLVQDIAEGRHPFAELLAQVADNQTLDDEHWHDLTTSLTRAFGKALATAAARGKLEVGAEAAPAPPRPVSATRTPRDEAQDRDRVPDRDRVHDTDNAPDPAADLVNDPAPDPANHLVNDPAADPAADPAIDPATDPIQDRGQVQA